MRPVKFMYSKVPNMGDLLNEYLMERVFHFPYVRCAGRIWEVELTGIGSFMDVLFTGPEKVVKNPMKRVMKDFLCSLCVMECNTWGTGFLDDYSVKRTGLIRNKVNFLAVRGKLTQQTIETILGREINPILGDGGILAPMLFEKRIPKKFEIGLIPHFREFQAKEIILFQKKYPQIHVIDLQADPIQVIREIASCEYIISSSLHGLILADGFRIPNIRIKMTDAPLGTGFKFDDYYSAYDIVNPARQIRSIEDVPTKNEILDLYQITDAMSKKMQDDMYSCMCKYRDSRR